MNGGDPDARRRSWAATRQRLLRQSRERFCVEDPDRPGKRIQTWPTCPHGTPGGYDNWRCQCAVVPGTAHRPSIAGDGKDLVEVDQLWWPVPGCEPVKLAALRHQRAPRPVIHDTETIDPDTTS